ncbi:MAG: hypothetical protein P1Q69_16130, partial [Candidatus Thorarchaeota archaeon]|nr:hypothetical protein [Candidatus Thorarchaeota archaeon]
KEAPREGTPHFLTLGVTFVISIIALVNIGPFIIISGGNWTWLAAAGLLLLCAILGIISFIYMFTRSETGLNLALFTAIVWFGIGILGFGLSVPTLTTLGFVIGTAQAVFAAVSIMVSKGSKQPIGGVN